jgi:hemerythrin
MTDYLVWQEGWNTDIPDIDEQHIAMANMLNQIVDFLNQPEKGKKHDQELDKLLSDFLILTREHFASEEGKMRQIEYPDYADHKNEHLMLQANLAQYILEIKRDQSAIDIGTLSALKHWFIAHITGDDKAFADYYHNKGLEGKHKD